MTGQKKSLDIQRGLFLVRYESADDRVSPPQIAITPEQEDAGDIEIITPPGSDDTVLWSPGACLVVRAIQGGRLGISVSPTHPNGSTSAKVQLVPLSTDPESLAGNRMEPATELDFSQFQIRGHVSRLGDVVDGLREWIAGPVAPSRIEGVALEWPDKPRNLSLRYAVRVGGERPTSTQVVDTGVFAGTRGRALPLVGANFEISGPGAEGYQLAIDALFLGSPQMRVAGQRVVLSGPTGREPLVGLRVDIERVLSSQVGGRPSRGAEVATEEDRERPVASDRDRKKNLGKKSKVSRGTQGRVRVFRSSASRSGKSKS